MTYPIFYTTPPYMWTNSYVTTYIRIRTMSQMSDLTAHKLTEMSSQAHQNNLGIQANFLHFRLVQQSVENMPNRHPSRLLVKARQITLVTLT